MGRAEFAQLTEIKKNSLIAIEQGRQRPTEELLEAIGTNWPQFAYWLITGNEIPEAGQISPETERDRQSVGKDPKEVA